MFRRNARSGISNTALNMHRLLVLQPIDSSIYAESDSDDDDFLASQIPRVGFMVPINNELKETLTDLQENGFEFMVVDIVKQQPGQRPLPIDDISLCSVEWICSVAGYIQTQECYSESAVQPLLNTQLAYARHLSLRELIFQCPEKFNALVRLSRVMSTAMAKGFSETRMLINIPLQSRQAQLSLHLQNPEMNPTLPTMDTWSLWNRLRSQLGYDRRLGIALEIDGDLPDSELCARWHGEPIFMIIIPFGLFTPKRNGIVLPGPYGSFINSLFHANGRQVSFVIKGHVPPEYQSPVVEYLKTFARNYVSVNLIDQFAIGYEDFLQIPLQPLANNLEASTYEIFEADPVKYEQYKLAMVRALAKFDVNKRVVVLLVGAGRGPLIRCSLKAAKETGRRIDLYAIEKNQCAANTLQRQEWVEEEVGENVTRSSVKIVNTDIRDWVAPELADIVISELLGSFSDNELSPECLDGVWKSVKPTAISIPESYCSYVQPVQSHKLFAETAATEVGVGLQSMDIHYVAHMKSFYAIADVQPLFEFEHKDLTTPPAKRDNTRYEVLSWPVEVECVIHGFAGYFDTKLIDEIDFSIVPETHTQRLISWFPTWIPLAEPVACKPGDFITLHFWRQVDKHKVWYEWCLQEPVATRIQNPDGTSYSVGLK